MPKCIVSIKAEPRLPEIERQINKNVFTYY